MRGDSQILPGSVPHTNSLHLWRRVRELTSVPQALRNREDFWCSTYPMVNEWDEGPASCDLHETIIFGCWARGFVGAGLNEADLNYLQGHVDSLALGGEAYFVYSCGTLLAWGLQYDEMLETFDSATGGWSGLHASLVSEANHY